MSCGGAARLSLSHDVYEPSAVREAAEAYSDHLNVEILNSSPNETEIVVRHLGGELPAERVLDEFLNHVLDLSVRRKLRPG